MKKSSSTTRADYPDVFAEEVGKTVRQVFGEVATCKIAHSQKLAKKVPAEVLDREYRSEQALTIALMGLMAEESLIAQRLGKLGRKKGATRSCRRAPAQPAARRPLVRKTSPSMPKHAEHHRPRHRRRPC